MHRLTTHFVSGALLPLIAACGSPDTAAIAASGGEPVPHYSAAQFFETTSYGLPGSADHGFRKRENRITASEAYVRFLDTHLNTAQ